MDHSLSITVVVHQFDHIILRFIYNFCSLICSVRNIVIILHSPCSLQHSDYLLLFWENTTLYFHPKLSILITPSQLSFTHSATKYSLVSSSIFSNHYLAVCLVCLIPTHYHFPFHHCVFSSLCIPQRYLEMSTLCVRMA